jgi:hypothetical protein
VRRKFALLHLARKHGQELNWFAQSSKIEALRVFPWFRPEDRRVTSKDLLHLDDGGGIAGGILQEKQRESQLSLSNTKKH